MAIVVQTKAGCAPNAAGVTVTFDNPVTIGNTVAAFLVYENNDGGDSINGVWDATIGPVFARNAGDQTERAAYKVATVTTQAFSATWTGGRAGTLYLFEIAGSVVASGGLGLQNPSAGSRPMTALVPLHVGRSGALVGAWENSHETYNNCGAISGNAGATVFGQCLTAGRMQAIGAYREIVSLGTSEVLGITVASPVGGGNSWSAIAILAEANPGAALGDTWIPPMGATEYV